MYRSIPCEFPIPLWMKLFSSCVIVTLLAVSAQAQSWPDEHVNGPFFYHADFPLRPLYPVLESVTELQHDIPRQLGLNSVEEPIHIFLFEQPSTYQNYVKKYFPTVPTRPALFVKQRGPGMVFARLGTNISVDLRHETAHAVLHSILPMVPLWLDEGLGEYFEIPEATRATAHSHLKSIRSRTRWGRVASIDMLEALDDLSKMNSEHYRDAWSWVHFMLHGPPDARTALQRFLQDIAAHVPPGKLSMRLRRNVPNLERAYLAHFRNFRSR